MELIDNHSDTHTFKTGTIVTSENLDMEVFKLDVAQAKLDKLKKDEIDIAVDLILDGNSLTRVQGAKWNTPTEVALAITVYMIHSNDPEVVLACKYLIEYITHDKTPYELSVIFDVTEDRITHVLNRVDLILNSVGTVEGLLEEYKRGTE